MARVLILGGAERGLHLAGALVADGHAVRVVTSDSGRREAIELTGAQSFLGAPDRLSTLHGALEHVAVACWLFADASGDPELVRALHGPRLERFICGAIDTTLRGFIYEAGGGAIPAEMLAEGRRIVSEIAARNSMPVAILTVDPLDSDAWLAQARAAVDSFLEAHDPGVRARYPKTYIPKSRSAFDAEASTQEDS